MSFLANSVAAELNAVDHSYVILKAGFDASLSIIALQKLSKIGLDKYVGVEHPFLGSDFCMDDASSLSPSRVDSLLWSGA